MLQEPVFCRIQPIIFYKIYGQGRCKFVGLFLCTVLLQALYSISDCPRSLYAKSDNNRNFL